jgi:hypothetical protein
MRPNPVLQANYSYKFSFDIFVLEFPTFITVELLLMVQKNSLQLFVAACTVNSEKLNLL